MLGTLLVIQLVVAGVLAFILIKYEERRAYWPLHIAGVVVMGGLFALMWWASRGEASGAAAVRRTLYFMIAALAYAPFLILLIIHYGASLKSVMMDVGSSVTKTYAGAKRAEEEGDYIRAARAYRRELEYDPRDVEARRRLAEVLVRMNRFDEALGSFRLALTHIKDDPATECAITFRIAEILVNKKLDFDMALEELDFVRKKYPDTRYAASAQKHLEKVFILKQAREERAQGPSSIPDTFDV